MTYPASPNIANYTVGEGITQWTPAGTSNVFDLGNCSRFEFSPKPQKLDHWNRRGGIRFKDLTVVQAVEGELVLSLDEFSYENIALAVGGSYDPNLNVIQILNLAMSRGQITFTGTTNNGPKKIWTFPSVVMIPSGKIDLISNEWAELELSGEVLGNSLNGSFGTIGDVV